MNAPQSNEKVKAVQSDTFTPFPQPCPAAKYRGAVQRTEGLNIQTKILSYLFTSTPKKRWFLRSFPVVPDATPYP